MNLKTKQSARQASETKIQLFFNDPNNFTRISHSFQMPETNPDGTLYLIP